MDKISTVGAERIAALFDSGTFVEIGAYMKRAGTDSFEGVVCGYGSINTKLVFAFSQDSDRVRGAVDELHAKKIRMLYEMASKQGAPVIGLFDTAGTMVYDGAAALAACGQVLKCASDASGRIPQIAMVPGVCPGMAAVAASMFDVVVTVEKQSQIYVNSPFLVGKEVGTPAYAGAQGLSSLNAADEADAIAKIRQLIDLLPSDCKNVAADECHDDCNRQVSVNAGDAKALIATLADNGSCIELGDAMAPEMVTALATLGGVTVGFVANNAAVNGGAITADAARKAAHLIQFCDSFRIPVITLVNSNGVAVSAAEEGEKLAAQLGKLAMSYASAGVARITAVTGNAFGASFTLMGSRALGADLVLALPEAKIGVLSPDAAVAFLWNDRVTAEKSRAELEAEWTEQYATPAAAAATGEVDDVVDPAELRQRLCAAVYAMMYQYDTALDRKHPVMPL